METRISKIPSNKTDSAVRKQSRLESGTTNKVSVVMKELKSHKNKTGTNGNEKRSEEFVEPISMRVRAQDALNTARNSSNAEPVLLVNGNNRGADFANYRESRRDSDLAIFSKDINVVSIALNNDAFESKRPSHSVENQNDKIVSSDANESKQSVEKFENTEKPSEFPKSERGILDDSSEEDLELRVHRDAGVDELPNKTPIGITKLGTSANEIESSPEERKYVTTEFVRPTPRKSSHHGAISRRHSVQTGDIKPSQHRDNDEAKVADDPMVEEEPNKLVGQVETDENERSDAKATRQVEQAETKIPSKPRKSKKKSKSPERKRKKSNKLKRPRRKQEKAENMPNINSQTLNEIVDMGRSSYVSSSSVERELEDAISNRSSVASSVQSRSAMLRTMGSRRTLSRQSNLRDNIVLSSYHSIQAIPGTTEEQQRSYEVLKVRDSQLGDRDYNRRCVFKKGGDILFTDLQKTPSNDISLMSHVLSKHGSTDFFPSSDKSGLQYYKGYTSNMDSPAGSSELVQVTNKFLSAVSSTTLGMNAKLNQIVNDQIPSTETPQEPTKRDFIGPGAAVPAAKSVSRPVVRSKASLLSPSSSKLDKTLPRSLSHHSNSDFKKHFDTDWTSPSALQEPSPTTPTLPSVRKANEPKIYGIDDNTLYDLIFKYSVPKSALFDLEDRPVDVKLKCIRKWLETTGNELYKAAFSDEIEAVNEEKMIKQLKDKVASLRKRTTQCDVCNKPRSARTISTHLSSRSTFLLNRSLLDDTKTSSSTHSSICPSEHPSDKDIEEEMTVLKDLLAKPVSDEDVAEYEDKDQDSERSEDDNEVAPLPSQQVKHEPPLVRRRRQIKEQLEKVVDLLQRKLDKQIAWRNYAGEYQGDEYTSKQSYFKTCHCEEIIEPSESVDSVEKLVNEKVHLGRPKLCATRTQLESPLSTANIIHREEPEVERKQKCTKLQRIQMYFLGMTNHWDQVPLSDWGNYSPQTQDGQYSNVGESHSIDAYPSEKETTIKPDHEPNFSEPGESETHATVRREVPFPCDCFCDRTSRLNAKKYQHFRPTLNENLWCFRGVIEPSGGQHSTMEKNSKVDSICPPEPARAPEDNFRGWLTDTDRNILLLVNRSPVERLKTTTYQGSTPSSTHHVGSQERVELLKEQQLNELINQISRTEAEKFWKQADEWYAAYKENDKVRNLLTELRQMDFNGMLKRDLALLQEEMQSELKTAKMMAAARISREQREIFDDKVKEMQAAYEQGLSNKISALQGKMEKDASFLVNLMMKDAEEQLEPLIDEFRQKCIKQLEELRDSVTGSSLASKMRKVQDWAQVVEMSDLAERQRRKLLIATETNREECMRVLGTAVKTRDVTIEEMERTVVSLTRDVDIWKRAVGDVLYSFKKYVGFASENDPCQGPYFANLEKLTQIQMDHSIKEIEDEMGRIESSGATSSASEIKCPSHDIRYPSGNTPPPGSSSDTDIDVDVRAARVADHAVSWLIRAALPSPELSEQQEEEENEATIEELLSTNLRPYPSSLVDQNENVESVGEDRNETSAKLFRRAEPGVHIVGVNDSEPNIHTEKFMKRRIKEMGKILAHKKPLLKSHIHL